MKHSKMPGSSVFFAALAWLTIVGCNAAVAPDEPHTLAAPEAIEADDDDAGHDLESGDALTIGVGNRTRDTKTISAGSMENRGPFPQPWALIGK